MQSALLQRLKWWWGQPVSAQTIRRTLHPIGVHGCHSRRKPLLKTIHKKARKQFAEDMSTKHMDYWNHAVWSDEMKINLFGSDGFKHVWRRPSEEKKDKGVRPTVKHGGGNVMVWGYMIAACVELHFIEGKHEFQHVLWNTAAEHDPLLPETGSQGSVLAWQWPQIHQDDHCFSEKSPDLNQIEHIWGFLKWKVKERKVSDICQLHDVVVKEWKSIPVATCENLANSTPRRVKAVLDNDGGHTKYWLLTWCILILTTFPKDCTHFCCQGFSF